MNVEHEARIRIEAMLKYTEQYGRPDLIPLSDYGDQNTFNFLLPGNDWTFQQWKSVNDEVARQLEAAGFKVQLVRLELNEYFDFLARYNLKNNPQNRAQFVSWKICPTDAKPDPFKD